MMQKLSAIIVDDEKDAQLVLTHLINSSVPDVEIIDVCDDVLSAVESIKKNNPDIVFLDIQMPEYAGYEIVKFIDPSSIKIIFVTAFNEFAVKAFDLSAVDYLLKPVKRQRLIEAVEKAREKKELELSLSSYKTLVNNLNQKKEPKILIKEAKGQSVLKLNDIISVEGQRAYSEIILASGKRLTVSKNLKTMQELFSDYEPLFRCHKSWIINTNHIERIVSSEQQVHLSDGRIVRVSTPKLKELMEAV